MAGSGEDVVKVRTTMRPDEETVLLGGERERKVLEARGLLYTGSATTGAGAARAVERQQAAAREESGQPTG